MKLVAVDANPAARSARTGTEVYAREVTRRLPKLAPDLDWRLYSSRPATGLGADLTVIPFPRLWSQLRLPAELASNRPDLLFVPAHAVPFAYSAPAVAVVHDLAFERFPDAYRPAQRAYLKLTTRWAARRCRRLIAVSEATRQDLERYYGVPATRVVVVHSGGGEAPADGAAAAPSLTELGIDKPFALHVGRVERRKNQAAALQVVERADPELLLVCAGEVIDEELAARLRASPRCRLLGRVDAAVRDQLYRQARVLIFPSLYEGFGFPVLEAMRNGLPVVASPAGGIREVGGDAALYAHPEDVEGLASATRDLLTNQALRRRLIAAGTKQAAAFSWDRCAQGVLEVIRAELQPGR
jgi:glycosyltransferase involved in cell wall biosynthesis